MFFLLLAALPFALIADMGILPKAWFGSELVVDIFMEVIIVLVAFSALMMMFKAFPEIDFYLVFVKKEHAFKAFALGSLLGFALISACVLVLYLNSNVVFIPRKLDWDMLLGYFIFFILIAIFEELLFRTYVLYAFADRYPLWFAAVLNGILFALAHFANPGITYLAAFNIFLAGVFFAVLTLQTRNVAWVVGLHFGWNFTQSVIFGYNVSGNEKISGLLDAKVTGLPHFSGGSFGIEGSLFCTLVLVSILAFILYKRGFGYIEYYADDSDGLEKN